MAALACTSSSSGERTRDGADPGDGRTEDGARAPDASDGVRADASRPDRDLWADASNADAGDPSDALIADGDLSADASAPDAGSCDPVTSTGCGVDEVCGLNATSELVCQTAGTTPLGARCTDEPCSTEGLCVDVGAGKRCYWTCDSAHRCVLGQCQALADLPFGVCSGVACSPIIDPCPENQTCSFVAGATGCEPAGATPIGGDCSSIPCQRGGLCAALTPAGRRCFAGCDDAHPCAVGQCTPLSGYPFGLCL